MSFMKQVGRLIRPNERNSSIFQTSFLNNIIQLRTATKRAAGSKTNKNDSAGRRLGPKAYEGHFVKPGQIIMRQRGTKIHPGENVDIGKDHTIFAIEPGYVRFYYDPFHPLRKYVGVALRKDLNLPTPHFSPRVRRFGYEKITDPAEAEKEENHMSRKEYLQQPELEKIRQEKLQEEEEKASAFKNTLSTQFNLNLSEADFELAVNRLLNISQLTSVGQSLEDAEAQSTYNYVFDLKLSCKRGEITSEEYSNLKMHYIQFAETFDKKVTIDAQGKPCAYVTPENKKEKQDEILGRLEKEFSNRAISEKDRETIFDLIMTPGIYNKSQQAHLKDRFLPSILPITVKETVVENIDSKKPPKGVTVTRIFDEDTKQIKVIGRTKEAFIGQQI
mmetsp:Transcript_8397/g.10227  ORF Transcript_8397/g.10227 Transcript_8397/m.10227 type:complete len:389 (+) Transcript_8397:45-1211(+)